MMNEQELAGTDLGPLDREHSLMMLIQLGPSNTIRSPTTGVSSVENTGDGRPSLDEHQLKTAIGLMSTLAEQRREGDVPSPPRAH